MAAVGEGTTEDERVALITTKLSSVVHCPLAGIALVDDTGGWTIRLEIRGEPVDVTPALTEQLEPLYRLAADGPPLIVATREGGPSAPAVPPVLEALRVRRLAVVKLVSSRHEIGVLFAGREASRPFSPSERLALLAVAQQAAVGIENLRLNEILLRHSRSLERQNALILDAAGEGVYGLDTEGLTTFVNPAAARLLGWGVGDLLGQPMHAVLHHTHADGSAYPPEECPIYAAFKDGQVHEVRDDVFWRWPVLAGSLALTLLAAIGATRLGFIDEYRAFFGPDNPQLAAFDEVEATYPKNDTSSSYWKLATTMRSMLTPSLLSKR